MVLVAGSLGIQNGSQRGGGEGLQDGHRDGIEH